MSDKVWIGEEYDVGIGKKTYVYFKDSVQAQQYLSDKRKENEEWGLIVKIKGKDFLVMEYTDTEEEVRFRIIGAELYESE